MKENSGTQATYARGEVLEAILNDRLSNNGRRPSQQRKAAQIGVSVTAYWRLVRRCEDPVSPEMVGRVLAGLGDVGHRVVFTDVRPAAKPKRQVSRRTTEQCDVPGELVGAVAA